MEDLQSVTYYYRYVLKDDEGDATYVLDKFNEETETIDGTEYSVCKYELFDVELQASMKNDSMDYNDKTFVTGDLSSVENFLSARNGAIDNTASLGAFLSSHNENGIAYTLMTKNGKTEEAHNLSLVAASLQLTAKGQGAQGDLNVPATMQVRSIPDQTYTGLSIKLSEDVLQVYHGTTKLTAGVDYSVRYKNNKAVGTATVTIKGKGNYKDSETVQFNIVPKSIEDPDVEITYNEYVKVNTKEQKPLSKITYNGKKLTTKEYQVEYYKLENNQKTGNALKGVKEVGDYQMEITGLKNYTGSVTETIHVVDKGTFMNTLKITLEGLDQKNSIAYEGTEIEPEVVVKDGDKTLKGSKTKDDPTAEYIYTYSNNVNVGTASVVITGVSVNEYYGSVTKTFRITSSALRWWWNLFS